MFYNSLFFSKTLGPLSLVSDIGLHHFQWLHTQKNTHTTFLHQMDVSTAFIAYRHHASASDAERNKI